jgi:hypothetical protein
MTHASSHGTLFWKLAYFYFENGSNVFLQSNDKMVPTHHTIPCHEAEHHIMKLNRRQCQVNLKS